MIINGYRNAHDSNLPRTKKRSTMQIIKDYQKTFDQSKGMQFSEASEIVCESQSKMEMVGNGYILGYMRGIQDSKTERMIPLYSIRQIDDERWNELATINKAKRETITA